MYLSALLPTLFFEKAYLRAFASLILDYRCMIIPRYVYADSSSCFDSEGNFNEEIENRIEEIVDSSIKLYHALATIKNN